MVADASLLKIAQAAIIIKQTKETLASLVLDNIC
jgi:hypothetical protein